MVRPSIQELLLALEKIDKAHYDTVRVRMVENELDITHEKFTTYENNFVAELKTQHAILVNSGAISEPRKYLKQLQIPKQFAWSKDSDMRVRNAFEELQKITGSQEDVNEQIKTIPDYIIHKSEKSKKMVDQFLIAEVKTESSLSYPKFAWDFFKLNLYLNKFNFQTACFLSVGAPKKLIQAHVFRYLREGHYLTERPEDLFIVLKSSFRSKPFVYSLKNTIALQG